jgi:hypothetical protein
MTIFAAGFPDALVMINNLSSAMEHGFSFLRYFLMVLAVMYMAFAIGNLYSITSSATGQPNKMFPSRSQPTVGSAWMQLVLAGLVMVTATTLLPIASSMSVITGDATISYYSVGSLDTTGNDLQKAVMALLKRAFVFIGLLAFYRGFATWWKITNGESEHKIGRVFGFFFFGLLCFNVTFVNAIVANTIGFDLFGFLLKTN